MELTIFDVEHGACALVRSRETGCLALIDCGHNGYSGWTPAYHLRNAYQRSSIEFLTIANTDQDHYSNLADFLENVTPEVLYFNPEVPPQLFEAMKRRDGPLSRDAIAYAKMRRNYTGEVTLGFNERMGGIKQYQFYNSPADFDDFNNLSIAVFLEYGNFQILFPGDLERPGWLKLLERPRFRALLKETNVLVAPHHGRINQNYCEEIFDYLSPDLVVISDKPIVHETQVKSASEYRRHVKDPGLYFAEKSEYRKVLTTRRDGAIHFSVNSNGDYLVSIGG